jgi:hypothetical protein
MLEIYLNKQIHFDFKVLLNNLKKCQKNKNIIIYTPEFNPLKDN